MTTLIFYILVTIRSNNIILIALKNFVPLLERLGPLHLREWNSWNVSGELYHFLQSWRYFHGSRYAFKQRSGTVYHGGKCTGWMARFKRWGIFRKELSNKQMKIKISTPNFCGLFLRVSARIFYVFFCNLTLS